MDQSTAEVTGKEKRTSGDESLGTGSEGLSSKERHAQSRVWRKIDIFVMPAITIYYFLAFLDRVNLGNARVAGMQESLGITNRQYSIALTVTYIPYVLAELPSNLLLKIVGPNIMIPVMVIFWGVATTLQGIVTSYAGLLACRCFLGLCEGGLFPGLVLYLSFFYPRLKLQWRISLFFCAASLTGAFSGILSYGIIKLDGLGGRPGWAWIFILEGLFTVLFGILTCQLLPRSPRHASFLTQAEKSFVIATLQIDGTAARNEAEDEFKWSFVCTTFFRIHVWILGAIYLFGGVIVYSLVYFMPSIILSLGYTSTQAQLMSSPPSAAAFFISMIGSYLSDRYEARGISAMVSFALCTTGFSMFLGSTTAHVRYAALFFCMSGIFLASNTLAAWTANNIAPHTRRATGVAFTIILTNCGGIFATWLMGSISPPPNYQSATITLLVMSVVCFVLSGVNLAYLWSQNKAKAAMRQHSAMDQEEPGLGDRSAWFVYTL